MISPLLPLAGALMLARRSAKSVAPDLADHTIVTYYHKEDNEASWDNFDPFSAPVVHRVCAPRHSGALR